MSAPHATLCEMAARLRRHGDAPAILEHRAGTLSSCSFARLADEAERLAAGLAGAGVRRGDAVAIIAPPGRPWLTAAFGIFSCGAVLLPLDAALDAGEHADMLADAGCRMVFAAPANAAKLCERGKGRFALYRLGDGSRPAPADADEIASWRSLMRAAEPLSEAACPAPDDRAALFYTSGTTGRPKGVPLTHAQIEANIRALAALGLIGPGDRVALPLPLHHVYPLVVGALTPLSAGAAVLLPGGTSGVAIADALRDGAPTLLIGVPRLYSALIDAIRRRAAARGRIVARLFAILLALARRLPGPLGRAMGRVVFRRLRARIAPHLWLMVSGGARLDEESWQTLEALGWTVLTGYGLTETAPILTFNPPRAARIGSEGRPLAGIELRIEAAEGADYGEVMARGPSVFTGYLNRPEETAAAFTADGWFRTGDLGRIDRDGYLTIVGRAKELIVLADGKKVFPDTIEAEYAASPLVREFAVLESGGALVGIAVPNFDALRERGAERADRLVRDDIDAIARTLPSYRRLTGLALVAAPLPRTPVGKLRRHLLAAIYQRGYAGAAPAAPEPSAEDRALLETPVGRRLWPWLQRRFPVHALSLDTSPQLDLGVDSLGWISLGLELQDRFGIVLTDERLARIVTLRDLLHEAQDASSGEPSADAMRHAPLPRRGPLLRAAAALLFAVDRTLLRVLFRLTVTGAEGVPATGALVIVPNHASWLDPLAIIAALPRRRLRALAFAGWTGIMFRGALSRLFSRIIGVLPVDPDRAAQSALALALAALRRDDALLWFPEGGRTRDGELLPFQPGIGMILAQLDVPVVPVWISGTFAAAPAGRIWPRFVKIHVSFGTSRSRADLAAHGAGNDEPERIAAGLRSAVAALAVPDRTAAQRG